MFRCTYFLGDSCNVNINLITLIMITEASLCSLDITYQLTDACKRRNINIRIRQFYDLNSFNFIKYSCSENVFFDIQCTNIMLNVGYLSSMIIMNIYVKHLTFV